MNRLVLLFCLATLTGCAPIIAPASVVNTPYTPTPRVDPRTQSIEDRKDELLRRLAVCESGDHGQSERPIYGARGLYIGRFQFTSQTVIGYTLQRDGVRLTVKEATDLAHDYDRAAALAKWVIFELDGIFNWPLCNRKLGLAKEVEAIKAL